MNRVAALLFATLGLTAQCIGSAAWADSDGANGGLGGLSPLSVMDLAGINGGPLVFSEVETSGDGTAAAATIDTGGDISIRSTVALNGSVAGAPIALVDGSAISTGGFGDIAMENGAGIAALQLSTGVNNVQQNAVSFVFVMSGLPQ
jgi:hypothetical protein